MRSSGINNIEGVQRRKSPVKKLTSQTYPSLVLQGHGITKGAHHDLRPLPEKADEPNVPYDDPHETYIQLSPENSEVFSTSTGQSSPTTGRFSNGFFSDSISSSLGTGITGRTSVYSWGIDDEFDQKSATQVCLMFSEIDKCLFENIKEPNVLTDECVEWRSAFPYLRVLGTQLIASKENGTQVIETLSDKTTELVTIDISDESENYDGFTRKGNKENINLNVNGLKIDAVEPPRHNDSVNIPLAYLKEEIFERDGDLEEFIAFDNNNIDYRENVRRNGRQQLMPPMSPHAFVHEAALSECFDHVWNEILEFCHATKLKPEVAWWNGPNQETEAKFERVQESFDRHIDRFLESSIELPQTRDGYGRLQPIASQFKVKSGMFATSPNHNGLQELITIRSLPLQHRAPSVTPSLMHMHNEEMPSKENISPSRPVSSVHRQFPQKMSNFRNAEQQFYDRMMSAKTPKRGVRLQPLQPPPKTAGQIENVAVGEVRGTKMQTASGLSALNQFWGPRNGSLPPLERVVTAEITLSNRDPSQAKSKRHSRASSAVSNDAKNQHMRDRSSFLALPDSRPYTTNFSTRVDTPSTSKNFQQTKSRDHTLSSNTKSFHSHASSGIPDSFYPFPSQMKNLSIASVGEENEVDDFVLLGHGPPLLTPSHRKGKPVGGNVR